MSTPARPLREALGTGALTGLIAGFAAGLIDALWSWGPAGQFVPGGLSRVRFVLYGGLALGLAGLVLGLLVAAGVLAIRHGTRLGELGRFAWQTHAERRARDPREALVGLSLALAGVPAMGGAIYAV